MKPHNDKQQRDDELDSKVNTDFDRSKADKKGSLTQQESPDTDPEQVKDKPGFEPSDV